MAQKTLKVCVTGAAGQIAYSFIPQLLSGQVFGSDVLIDLRLLDIPQCVEIVNGVILEIEDCAYPNLVSVVCGSDPNVLFKDIDVGVFIGGFPRKEGMERKDLLAINGKIFKEQGSALNDVANPNVKCIVVANPANTNANTLSTFAPNIPKENFTALTRLDHNRAKAQIASKAGVHTSEVKNVIIWGNHSTTQYPDFHNGTVGGKPLLEVISDQEYLKNEFIPRVQKRGGEIIKVRKGSSVFSAANAVKDHLKDWYFGNANEYVSMAVITDGKNYGVPAGLCFSYPIKCTGNFKYEIVQGIELNEYSQEKLKITTQELEEEKSALE